MLVWTILIVLTIILNVATTAMKVKVP